MGTIANDAGPSFRIFDDFLLNLAAILLDVF